MNIQEFYNYIKHPYLLNELSLNELSEVIRRYPYFQAARMLYLKNLFLLNDDRYQAMLTQTSIYAPDRKTLYFLINQKNDVRITTHDNVENESQTHEAEKPTILKAEHIKENDNVKPSTQQETKKVTDKEIIEPKQQPISIADQILNKINENKNQTNKIEQTEKEEICETTIEQKDLESSSFTFDEWLYYISSHKEQEKTKEKTISENSLIDQFLDNASSLTRIKVEQGTVNEDLTEQLIPAEELEMISEPLAQLYYKQGYYDKALKMYEKLILNNPEKSIYFASLIQEIKNKLDKS